MSYNDASLTDEDFTGLLDIFQSIKEDDPLKVGKFGLGFKSCFHITGEKVDNVRVRTCSGGAILDS